MGQLTELLGCGITWSQGCMQLKHPEKGNIPIQMAGGLSTLLQDYGFGADH